MFRPNEKLMESKKLSVNNKEKMREKYKILSHVIEDPACYEDPVKLINEIESEIQFLWGFEKNENNYRYWNKISGCCCPKYDNDERVGTPYRIISSECKWHTIKGDEK